MSSLLTPSTEETRGEVHARDRVIQYRRLGPAGTPATVLLGAADGHDLWSDLPSLLAVDRRVFVPMLRIDADVATESLASLLEGLGLARTCVIAGGPFAMAALELAMSGGDLVAQLVLVGEGNGFDEQGTLSTRSSALSIPLLVLPRRSALSDAHVRLRTFLEGDAGNPF